MIKSEKAVSEVIGMVLILSIMVIVIGSIMLVGVPMIESSRDRAKMDVAANTFLSLQNDIEEVVRGPIWVEDPLDVKNISVLGPSRETEFELMGGTISVLPNSNGLIYYAPTPTPTPPMPTPGNNILSISSGNITYTEEQESIIYENGAVIRKYEAGEPLMISEPLISIYDTGDGTNITISIHAISINGTLSSVGGDGKAWVETRLMYYKPIVETIRLNRTNITINSTYPEAWKAFFDKKLQGAGLNPSSEGNITGYYIYTNDAGRWMQVQIYGKGSIHLEKDIFLSVYESTLDVKAR